MTFASLSSILRKKVNKEADAYPEKIPKVYAETWFKWDHTKNPKTIRGIILTACNPFGRVHSEAINRSATDKLVETLTKQKLPYFPIIGGSKDFSHEELSFVIEGMTQEAGKQLAQSLRQVAIFKVESDVFHILHCWTDEDLTVGSFSARCIKQY